MSHNLTGKIFFPGKLTWKKYFSIEAYDSLIYTVDNNEPNF